MKKPPVIRYFIEAHGRKLYVYAKNLKAAERTFFSHGCSGFEIKVDTEEWTVTLSDWTYPTKKKAAP